MKKQLLELFFNNIGDYVTEFSDENDVVHHYHKPNSQWYTEKTFCDPGQSPTKITILFDFPQLNTDTSHKFPKFLIKKTPGFLMKSDS